jgi:hypothetical protein
VSAWRAVPIHKLPKKATHGTYYDHVKECWLQIKVQGFDSAIQSSRVAKLPEFSGILRYGQHTDC